MNRKSTKETLEEKMARVALKKQKILEEKKSTARKFMTPRVQKSNSLDNIVKLEDPQVATHRVNRNTREAQNGWEKRQNGWVKSYKPISYK